MGAFNTLRALAVCTFCNKESEYEIQFKYGNKRQYEYQLGDVLRWGGNDEGVEGAKRVVVDGASSPCKHCGKEIDHLIYIEQDVIMGIEVNAGQYDFSSSKGYYLVLEE